MTDQTTTDLGRTSFLLLPHGSRLYIDMFVVIGLESYPTQRRYSTHNYPRSLPPISRTHRSEYFQMPNSNSPLQLRRLQPNTRHQRSTPTITSPKFSFGTKNGTVGGFMSSA